MLIPQKFKFKKSFKGRMRGFSKGHTSLCYGDCGLKAIDSARLNSQQIEAARRVIARVLNKVGKVWICVFPNVPVSKKPTDVRMGKGKGPVDCWVFKVRPGRILFEIAGVSSNDLVFKALSKASAKLPMKCKIVKLEEM